MAETITIARPYAKAVFECAASTNKLQEWSKLLHILAYAVVDPQAASFLNNPATTLDQRRNFLVDLAALSLTEQEVTNFILTLIQYKRVMLLPDILTLFETLRSEREKTLKVKVVSFSELSAQQIHNLTQVLRNKLNREIEINVIIDKSLIGGFIVYAGDLVINGSVREKLTKLANALVA
jgi:F-type H+-transporting ATPase subunit delta